MKPFLLALSATLVVSTASAYDRADFRLDHFGGNRPAVSDISVGNSNAYRPRPRHDRAEWHGVPRHHASSPSVTEIREYGGEVEAGSYYGTSGASVSPSVVVIGSGQADMPNAREPAEIREGGPKILDIASARLDRRPFGPDGIDVVEVGPARIIRIAPGFRASVVSDTEMEMEPRETPYAALSARERAVTVYPDPDELPSIVPVPRPKPSEPMPEAPVAEGPAPLASPAATAAVLEPWTPDWLRDCVARYPSFDASLGTYLNEAGQRRFCTGER